MTEPTAAPTVYRGCDWIVAWDEAARSHCYLPGADLAVSGRELTFVGHRYDGPVGREIDGRGAMLIPGFVNIHSHPGHEPGWKGRLEELGFSRLGQSSFDIAEDIEMLRRGLRDVIAGAPGRDWAGRTLEESSPRVYPVRHAPPVA